MHTIAKIVAAISIIALPLVGRTMLAADAPSVMMSASIPAPVSAPAAPAPAAPPQSEAPEAPAPKARKAPKVCGPRSAMAGRPPRTMRCDGSGELLTPTCRPCKGRRVKGK